LRFADSEIGTAIICNCFTDETQIMTASRTIKTLLALLVAMTAGAFALRLIQSEPIRLLPAAANGQQVDSARYFSDLKAPLRDWKVIEIRTTNGDSADSGHFVITADGETLKTDRWIQQWQLNARNAFFTGSGDMPYCIGITVKCDARHKVTPAQKDELIRLANALQTQFDIDHPNADDSNILIP